MKFDPDDPEQGIFFIAGDGTTHQAEIVIKNSFAELIFIVPADLVRGDYRLEVRASFGQDSPRSSALDKVLTVGE